MMEEIDLEKAELEDLGSKFALLQELVPDADPTFLYEKCQAYAFQSNEFQLFVDYLIESNDYPKKPDIMPEVPEPDSTSVGEINLNFDVQKFVDKFNDPVTYFSTSKEGLSYKEHSFDYLKSRFQMQTVMRIMRTLKKHQYNLYLTSKELESKPSSRATKRPKKPVTSRNQAFIYEVMFIEHEAEIITYLQAKVVSRNLAILLAQKRGELCECLCCFSTDLLFDDIILCSEGHSFCKSCVKRGAEVHMGDGKFDFPCLTECNSKFEMESLQIVLPAAVIDKILKQKQAKEVQEAAIPGLETCPFCEYAEIPPEGDRLFRCKSCRKESCRECRRPGHIPLKCDEALQNDQIRARTFIEDRMTEALVRECYQCKNKFVKIDGCNKMTCICGAKMCYLCRKPVKDYSHFTERNTEVDKDVKKAGEEAKEEVLKNIPEASNLELDLFKGLTPTQEKRPRLVVEPRRRIIRRRRRRDEMLNE